MTIPMDDVLQSYRQAALRIAELRRKGIPCHLEKKANENGHYLRIVPKSAGSGKRQLSAREKSLVSR
jgi:hypothetical protein